MDTKQFTNKTLGLAKEAYSFKKYKAMSNKFLRVLLFILLIPSFVIFTFAIGFILICAFCIEIAFLPVAYLHNIVKEERKEIRHATEAIVYLCSWPIVFFFYTYIAFAMLFISIAYAVAAIFGWLWTLRGFKFHVSMNEENIVVE